MFELTQLPAPWLETIVKIVALLAGALIGRLSNSRGPIGGNCFLAFWLAGMLGGIFFRGYFANLGQFGLSLCSLAVVGFFADLGLMVLSRKAPEKKS